MSERFSSADLPNHPDGTLPKTKAEAAELVEQS